MAVRNHLTSTDRERLSEAKALMNDVIHDHPLALSGPIITAFGLVVSEIDNLERQLDHQLETETHP